MSLRKDHRPYYLKKLHQRFERWYTHHFLKPQFEYLGPHPQFLKPWNIEVFGPSIRMGCHGNIVTTHDRNVRINIWGNHHEAGRIEIGDYVFIGPGVRISAANEITIGNNCLIASGVYITDSDWHGLYNRVALPDLFRPVTIHDNVWLGDSCIVLKGVTIGENSVVGAGAVVTRDVPPNTVVSGNPAQEVKKLDPDEPMVTREMFFSDPTLDQRIEATDREMLKENTLLGWLLAWIKPPRDG